VSRLLLDTTFLIDAERAEELVDESIDDEDDVAVAAISVAEMKVGVALADGRRRGLRRDFITDVLAVIPVLEYDLNVAVAHAQLLATVRRQGRPRGAHDLVIAATAVASGREVVTADTGGFVDLPGVRVRSHIPGGAR
jgi:tRNA(fMet)-specific endonuclease VapC